MIVGELSRMGSADHTKELSYENGRWIGTQASPSLLEKDGLRPFGRIELPDGLS